MVRCIPYFLTVRGPLTPEELLTPVEPRKGILFAIVRGEGELVRPDL
jgi:hypothetical protein